MSMRRPWVARKLILTEADLLIVEETSSELVLPHVALPTGAFLDCDDTGLRQLGNEAVSDFSIEIS